MEILLHICCGPCALYPVQILRMGGFEPTGFFYNHNIHPYQEYARRLSATREMASSVAITLLVKDDYDLELFLANVAAYPGERCAYCYSSRLRTAAAAAAENGFGAFTSSLLYSRYQNHNEIRLAGEHAAREFGVDFHYEDFRIGWNEGIRMSKETGLYRQQYCGCVYSEKERFAPS